MNDVTPNEIARKLGVTGLQLRNWLRNKWRAGDPRLAGHRKNDRWSFSPSLAAELEREYRDEHSGSRRPAPAQRSNPVSAPRRTTATSPTGVSSAASDDAPTDHRITMVIDGEDTETLADLLRPRLVAVVVGINPAPDSVAAGHYWQGPTGSTLWRRLRSVGLLPSENDGFEDDAAFAAGVGFTDVVKRPTPGADEVGNDELAAGRAVLEAKLKKLDVPLVLFAFKKAATTLLGDFAGNGFVDRKLGSSRVFVMPGPYESLETADRTLATLAAWVLQARAR